MSISNLRKRNLQSFRTSRETGPGSSEIQPWDVLYSRISEYELQRFRFSGCFSEVAECKDIKTKEIMAIKILKKRANDSQEPNRELAMLQMIRGLDPDNIVRFFDGFEHKGHTCLAFEMLDKNLHELLRERRGYSFSLQEIIPITQQLLTALESLKMVSVIHTNIKPQNIMLVNQKDQPFRVKLIDFGSAITAAEVKRRDIMQPVGYRSPDVILGLPISVAVDMWSLGCVLATMYLGSLPFPQRCQYYLMKTMVETLGQPEDELLNDGTNTLLYFNLNQDSTKPAWRLKTADEYKAATGFPPQNHKGSLTRLNCLDDLVMLYPEENFKDRITFVSLLQMMLHLNPQKRITPSEALIHPFLTLSQLDDDNNTSSHEMASGTPMSFSPVVESAEELNTSVTSNYTDEEPIDDGDSAAVDIADRATAIMSSTDVASAATESSNKDSAASCSGVENLPAICLDDEASDGAAFSAGVMAGLNDTVSAGDEALESTVGLDDATVSADEALSESIRAESNDAGPREEDSAPSSSGVENLPAVYINGGDSDADGSYDQVTDDAAGLADDDEAAVTPDSTEASTAPATTDLYDAVSADKGTVTTPSTDEAPTAPPMTESDEAGPADKAAVKSLSTGEAPSEPLTVDFTDININSDTASATSSRNTQRELLKRIRKFFGRMLRALCCCCSVDVVE